jgi:hypothetical protein
MAAARQDHAGEDRQVEAGCFAVQQAIFDAEFDIAGTGAGIAVCMGQCQRQRRRQLHAGGRPVIEVEPGCAFPVPVCALASPERVDFPMMEIGRLGIVGDIGRSGPGRSRQRQPKRRQHTQCPHDPSHCRFLREPRWFDNIARVPGPG